MDINAQQNSQHSLVDDYIKQTSINRQEIATKDHNKYYKLSKVDIEDMDSVKG